MKEFFEKISKPQVGLPINLFILYIFSFFKVSDRNKK
jgi:hypothetical protein